MGTNLKYTYSLFTSLKYTPLPQHTADVSALLCGEHSCACVFLADSIISQGEGKGRFPKQNKAKDNTTSVWPLLFDILLPGKTV